MENQFTPDVERRPRKGLAVTSLVLGILSIPTLGLALVGGVISLILGIIALRKAKRDPATYGGKSLAIAGIVTSCVSFILAGLIGVVAAIAIPNLLKSAQAAREVSAIQSVTQIGNAQVLYSATKGKGKFADLRTLAGEGLIDQGLGSGERDGYLFSTTPLNAAGQPLMFDTTARPISIGPFGTGNRSFYSNETMVIWEADGGNPPQPSPSDRVPRTGSMLRDTATPLRDLSRPR